MAINLLRNATTLPVSVASVRTAGAISCGGDMSCTGKTAAGTLQTRGLPSYVYPDGTPHADYTLRCLQVGDESQVDRPAYIEGKSHDGYQQPAVSFLSGIEENGVYVYTGINAGQQGHLAEVDSYSMKITDSADFKVPVTGTTGVFDSLTADEVVGDDDIRAQNGDIVLFKSPGVSSIADREKERKIICNRGDTGLAGGHTCDITMHADSSQVRGVIAFNAQSHGSVPPSTLAETMRVSGNRVGIQTTTPEATLDVNGALFAESTFIKGNASSRQLNVGPMFQQLSTMCAHLRSPNTVDTVGGQIFIEAGRDSGGDRAGWGSLNFNGYLNGAGGWVRSAPTKLVWALRADQRTAPESDNFSISSLDPINPQAPVTIPWLSCGGSTMELGGRLLIDRNATAVRPTSDNTIDLGSSAYKWKDVHAGNATIQVSDLKLKKQVVDLTKGLDFINQLRPVEYKFKAGTSGRRHYGLIAQEVETLFHSYGDLSLSGNAIVVKNKQKIPDPEWTPDEEDIKAGVVKHAPLIETAEYDYALRYGELIAPLIKAIQELSARVKDLEDAS